MNTKFFNKMIVLALVVLLAFGIATPALAFDPRTADTIIINADEVIDDDLYLFANTITINGRVKGDVIAFGSKITVNGVIDGDLMAAGNDVTVNGEVRDDLRFAAYALVLGPEAKVGDDVLAACFSLEASQGSSIGGTLALAAYQALLSGQVNENARLGFGRLELNGVIKGDAKITIGDASEDGFHPSTNFMGNDVPVVPNVETGLNFGPEAKINGNLDYTSTLQYNVPSGVVGGTVSHAELPVSAKDVSQYRPMRETNPVLWGILEALRFLTTLVVLGLLVALLKPDWIRKPAELIEKRPLPSLGWGFVACIAMFFVLGALFVAVLALTILFAALTLGSLAGLSATLGVSTFMAVVVAFWLVSGYLAYLIVGYLGGRWILDRINPKLTEKPYWSLLLGVLILAVLTAIPLLGGLVKFVVTLGGVGAVAILIWEHYRRTPETHALTPMLSE